MTDMNQLKRAIDALGGPARAAAALGVSRMCVYQWRKRGVPAARAAQIEKATGGAVTREKLCPELFGAIVERKKGRRKGQIDG